MYLLESKCFVNGLYTIHIYEIVLVTDILAIMCKK